MQDDIRLYRSAVSGDRNAFAAIVERYQNLVCAVAYSSLGNLESSEDVAQETFVSAWKSLLDLQDPAKLKAWLCGIARNQSVSARRCSARRVAAHSIEHSIDTTVDASLQDPSTEVIQQEERAILWSVLESLPQTYREPLILYYRNEQSIAEVAAALDVTEDTAKQRLARGRKMLKAEVTGFVERALEASRPRRSLAPMVLAALPGLAVPGSAAAGGAVVGKGAAAKAAVSSIGLAGMILGPLLGAVGAFIGIRAGIKSARSARERRFAIRFTYAVLGLCVLLFTTQAIVAAYFRAEFQSLGFQMVLWTTYLAILIGLIQYGNARQHAIRIEDGTLDPQPALAPDAERSVKRSAKGGLAGAMIGGVGWLIPMSYTASDWLPIVVVVPTVLIAWLAICRWLDRSARPQSQQLAIVMGLCAVCAMDVIVATWRWSTWQASAADHAANQISLWFVNTAVILFCAIGSFGFWFARRTSERTTDNRKS